MQNLIVCPHCASPLTATEAGRRCAGCGRDYPTLGGVPCLLEDAPLWRGLWKSRLDDYLAVTAARQKALAEEAASPDLLESTRRRLRILADALDHDQTTLRALFEGFAPGGASPGLLPSPDPRGETPALIKYSEHLFRDYVWGEKEAESAVALVKRLASEPSGTLAVLGAGTGRLALDLHRTLAPSATLGFDVNPLPLLVLARLLGGAELELTEYPLAPHSVDAVAVRQRLRAPPPPGEGVFFAFADALRPPLAPESVDTIVTPWFIDAVGADVHATAAAINRLLRPGGTWLNFGPLRFETLPSRSYLIEEVHEIVTQAGFELGTTFSEDAPYFHSPHSGVARIDRLFAFAAEKLRPAPPVAPPRLFAAWLSDPGLPVPFTPALAALRKSSVLTVGIASMIDGRRSIRDIAGELAAQWRLPPAALEIELRTYLARLPLD